MSLMDILKKFWHDLMYNVDFEVDEPTEHDRDQKREQVQATIKLIETWHTRAGMAFENQNRELCAEALKRKWQYQRDLAALEGSTPPATPEKPEDIFGEIDY